MKNKLEKITNKTFEKIPAQDRKHFVDNKKSIFQINNKNTQSNNSNDPLLGFEIALHGCNRAGVFNKKK